MAVKSFNFSVWIGLIFKPTVVYVGLSGCKIGKYEFQVHIFKKIYNENDFF